MGGQDYNCPHHIEIERRLQEGREQFGSVLAELKDNNRKLERLITTQENQTIDVTRLKNEVWGEEGQNGLKGRQQKTQTALTVFIGLITGSGGIWGFYELIKSLSQ